MAWAMKQNAKHSTTKLVLIMLSNYADKNNYCYPSQEHIAKVCQLSRRSVIVHIKKLVDMKLIRKEQTRKGVMTYNGYYIQCEDSSHNTNIRKDTCLSLVKKKKNKNFLAG